VTRQCRCRHILELVGGHQVLSPNHWPIESPEQPPLQHCKYPREPCAVDAGTWTLTGEHTTIATGDSIARDNNGRIQASSLRRARGDLFAHVTIGQQGGNTRWMKISESSHFLL
jgi:hypothetical protein